MKVSKDAYRCWFFINQGLEFRPYVSDENTAAATFIKFLTGKDYGKSIRLFRFDIYVEPKMNFGKHWDVIYLSCAHLTAHIDHNKFISADDSLRHKFLLNAALILCTYLQEKVALPKNFTVSQLVHDYTAFLKENTLLLTEEERSKVIIKPFETTKFNFVVSTTAEVDEKDIYYDLNKIQDFINNNLSGKTFGKSVRQFDFGYEIYDFQGYLLPHAQTANLKRYGAKYKRLLVVRQFDYRQIKGKTHFDQFKILKDKIIEAIDEFDNLNRKPRDFDKQKFKSYIDQILTEYSNTYCH